MSMNNRFSFNIIMIQETLFVVGENDTNVTIKSRTLEISHMDI